MRWQRLDVWDGDPVDRDGRFQVAAIRQKAGMALAALDGVTELLNHAHRTGRFIEPREAMLGAALVKEMARIHWLLTAVLLQPNQQQDNEEQESERNGYA